MDNEERYTMIESLIAELRRNDHKTSNVHSWALLSISGNELLHCDCCYKEIQRQDMHISVTNDSKKVLCEECWKKVEEL